MLTEMVCLWRFRWHVFYRYLLSNAKHTMDGELDQHRIHVFRMVEICTLARVLKGVALENTQQARNVLLLTRHGVHTGPNVIITRINRTDPYG